MPRKRRALLWTEKAQSDLEAVRSYIARDKPIAADRFIARIKRAVANLKSFPHLGELLARDDESEIREIYVKSYRVLFRVREDSIRVLTIIHGARDFKFIEDELEKLE